MDKSFYYTFYYRETLHFAIGHFSEENQERILVILPEEESLLNEFGPTTIQWNTAIDGHFEGANGQGGSSTDYKKSIVTGLQEYIKNHPSQFL